MSWVSDTVMNILGADKLISMAMNWLLNKLHSSSGAAEYYVKIEGYLHKTVESLNIIEKAIEDGQVSTDEVNEVKTKLLTIWG